MNTDRSNWKAVDYVKAGWCQWEMARTSEHSTDSRDPKAIRWCSIGAIYAVYEGEDRKTAIKKLARVIGSSLVSDWNDQAKRTQAEVIEAFEKAGI